MKRILIEALALLSIATCLALAVNLFSPRGLALTEPLAVTALDARYIAAETARARFESGQSIFVDARPASEFAAGHIEGALNLPADAFDQNYPSMAAFLPREVEIVVCCDGQECDRSKQVATRLQELGYGKVKIFYGGWKVWRQRGWPSE